MDHDEPLPDWLRTKLRRSARSGLLSWIPALLSVGIILGAVEGLWWFGMVENFFVPLFWNALFLVAAYLLGSGFFDDLRLYRRPATSPEVAYLRRFGSLDSVTAQIQAELRSPVFTLGNEAVVTNRWLVVLGGKRFAARRLEDLTGAYEKIDQVKIHHVLPIWSFHYAAFRCAGAPDASALGSKAAVRELLTFVVSRRPGIARELR